MTSESNKQVQPDTKIDFAVLAERLRPLEEAQAGKSDAEVARAIWRKLMITAGACADCAATGEGPIVNALDKAGAFLDKAASGFVQLNSVLKDFGAEDSVRSIERRPHEHDPLARAIETWTRAG